MVLNSFFYDGVLCVGATEGETLLELAKVLVGKDVSDVHPSALVWTLIHSSDNRELQKKSLKMISDSKNHHLIGELAKRLEKEPESGFIAFLILEKTVDDALKFSEDNYLVRNGGARACLGMALRGMGLAGIRPLVELIHKKVDPNPYYGKTSWQDALANMRGKLKPEMRRVGQWKEWGLRQLCFKSKFEELIKFLRNDLNKTIKDWVREELETIKQIKS